ncbi:hypothetical protein ACOWK0_07270 [Helicobacter pylori]
MRQKNETATSFNQLKEITQAIQAQKASEQAHANTNASEPTQKQGNNANANAFKSDEAFKQGLETRQSNQRGQQ